MFALHRVWGIFGTFFLGCDAGPAVILPDDSGESPGADSGADDDALPGEPPEGDFGCGPTAGDVEAEEGEVVSVQFRCVGAGVPDSWRLVTGPTGATLDSATGELTWATDLASAGEWRVTVAAVKGEERESGEATIWVADAWDQRGNTPVDPLTYTYEFGLPVFHLEVPDNIDNWAMYPGTVTYRGEEHVVEAQTRGAASSYYPKKSYRVDFEPQDEFRDEDEGFPKRHSIVLTSTFDDNAYFRQKLCFDIWNLLDGAHRVETMFAVVYLNGEYLGLYLLGDHIDGNWWEDQGHWEDGNLYKSVDHSANFYATYGGPKSSWHSGYEQKDGLQSDFADLDGFVEFVARSSDSEFEAGIADYVSLEQIYDWWALVIFTEADDSAGKNAYFYNDPNAPGFFFAPWDFNHSLGQTWQTDREPATYAESFTGTNNLFRRLLLSPTYGELMSQRFADARTSVLTPAAMDTVIDAYIARIDPSARRDWDKWEADYRSYSGWSWRSNWTDYDEEVAYTRQWVHDRWAFIEDWDP